MRRYAATGWDNDEELPETAESRGLGALPSEENEPAPAVALSLEYDPSPRVGWAKWGALAVLGALVLLSGRKAAGR